MSGPLNANAQLEAIEKLIQEVHGKTRGLSPDDRDAPFSSVVQAMEFMMIRSRALRDIEKLIQENDAGDVDLKLQDDEGQSGTRRSTRRGDGEDTRESLPDGCSDT